MKESSWIAFIDYDVKNKTLTVSFKDSTQYIYLDVPQTIFQKFIKSKSLGNFLNTKIKPKYKYLQIN